MVLSLLAVRRQTHTDWIPINHLRARGGPVSAVSRLLEIQRVGLEIVRDTFSDEHFETYITDGVKSVKAPQ